MIRTFFANNRLTITIAAAALVLFPLLGVWVSSNEPRPVGPTAPPPIGVVYPRNYRQDFTHYATIQRPDGTIRELYINPVGLSSIRSFYNLPVGTVIVSEGYDAVQDSQGNYLTDAQGRYVKGKAMPFVHVREKRAYWSAEDFTSAARNDDWNFGSFDMTTGAMYDESLNACFLCHNTAPYDFTYSLQQLADFTQSGAAVYFMCRTTGRTACE